MNDIQKIKASTKMEYRRARINWVSLVASLIVYTAIIALCWVFVVVYMSVL